MSSGRTFFHVAKSKHSSLFRNWLSEGIQAGAVSLAFSLCLTASMEGSPLVDDPFSYAVNTALGSTGNWTNEGSGDDVVVVAGSLTAPTGVRTATGNAVSFGGNGLDPVRNFTPTSSTVFYSFLFQVNNLGTLDSATGGYFAGLGSSLTALGSTVHLRTVTPGAAGTGTFNIGFDKGKNTGTFSDDTYQVGESIFIVGSYTYNSGTDDDVARLWINPQKAGNSTPKFELTTGVDLGAQGLERFFLRQDSAIKTPGVLVFDELRVATTYAEVTSVPEPSAAILLVAGAALLQRRRK